jgi:chromatin segregation and condensation protein Rec8/ScpA/Scc1 (kleisin family)
MLSDNELIDLMVNEPSWEDVIVRIVAEEQMDPWVIDLVKLADTFGSYVTKLDQLDLRVPARFVLITAILLRMKSDILANRPQRQFIAEGATEQKDAELIRLLASIPPLQAPVKRVPVGSVTMEELLTALRKAFEVKERREQRKLRIRQRVEQVLPVETEDITKRIQALLDQINGAISDIEGSTTFKSLVKNWERKDIVKQLLPMLHLSQEGKITHEQPVLFDDIIIKKKVPVKVE